MNPKLPMRCRLDDYSGYGQFSAELALEMSPQVEVFVEGEDFCFSERPSALSELLQSGPNEHPWELLLHGFLSGAPAIDRTKKTVYFTMWETTGVGNYGLARLNAVDLVLVPSSWCASCFLAAGAEPPVQIVPLGIKTENFQWAGQQFDGPFVFGLAGAFRNGGIRKGLELAISAFQLAFTKGENVELHIKAAPGSDVPPLDDARIQVTRQYLSMEELREWYAGLNVYVSGSSSEGWGRHQQEAMATGRPVIGVKFGGITEFWNPSNGYEVDYVLTEASGLYAGYGYYALPSIESMIEQMQLAYTDRDLLLEKSDLSRRSALLYPVSRSASTLLKMLQSYGYL